MPRLMDNENMDSLQTDSNFKFSAVRLDDLGASEYSLVTIVLDISSSVSEYRDELEQCIKTVLDACQKSPRSDNLMLRLVAFNQAINELHGFKLLSDIPVDDYTNIVQTGGMTALFDATYECIDATGKYGENLAKGDYLVNAVVFVITDGEDNSSTFGPAKIKDLVAQVYHDENLESITTVLVGVGDDLATYLQKFKDEAGLNQFVNIGEATPGKLAKLADFVSRSISSTSQALGSGAASQPLGF